MLKIKFQVEKNKELEISVELSKFEASKHLMEAKQEISRLEQQIEANGHRGD